MTVVLNVGATVDCSTAISNDSTRGETFQSLSLSDALLGLGSYDLLAGIAAGDLSLTGDDGDNQLEPGED